MRVPHFKFNSIYALLPPFISSLILSFTFRFVEMRRQSLAPPSRLVQTCKESSDFCTIDCPNVTSGGYLTARGFPTSYFYIAQSEILTLYRYGDTLSSSREIFKHNFGPGTMVASVAYFRINGKS
jgi:hypothetical protein